MAGLVIILILCTIFIGIYFAVIPQHQRIASAKWLFPWAYVLPRWNRISQSRTSPRPLSAEKKVPNNATPPVQYRNIFPPSRRGTLETVAEGYPEPVRSRLLGSRYNDLDFRKSIIPFTANYRECGLSTYTPMGFSIEEIRALGDFPDYAELSGVQLPVSYKSFKIETACARPYRPFRWPYHQTMCTNLK